MIGCYHNKYCPYCKSWGAHPNVMSFYEHATYGTVIVIGLQDKIYINHPITLSENPENSGKDMNYFLHCIALNKKEAQDLMYAIQAWIKLGEL